MIMNLPVPSIRASLRKLLPHLLQAQEQNLNEADTVQRVVKVFEEVLGYDPMAEISREAVVKGKYVDLALKIGSVTRFLVEVKSAGTVLRDRHTDQARSYAAEGNVPWVVLTNGLAWNLYHLTFQEGIEHDLVFAIDLAAQPFEQVADALALLHRDSIRKDLHEECWRKKSALSAQSIGRAIFTEPVLRMIRREIRRGEGMSVDEDHLVAAIRELLSVEAREQIGVVKVRRRRRKRSEVGPPADGAKVAEASPPPEKESESRPIANGSTGSKESAA